MSNLVIKNPSIPIKAIPKEDLKELLETKFAVWISDLLGLTGEDAAKRLIMALPAIEKHFWSLGFEEIEKAFTMYADSELITKPIPNYFTRILVGQIFKEYKQQKPVVKKKIIEPEITQEEKDNLTYIGVINCFDDFVQNNKISSGYTWVYDHLEELSVFKYTDKEKRKQMPIAREKLIKENKTTLKINEYKHFINDLENKRADQAVINTAKKMLLERYFLKLVAKNIHIKEKL